MIVFFFFFSSRRRHTRYWRDWSSDVCSSDLVQPMSITFRRATRADARASADLWLRARQAAVGVIPPAVHGDDDVRAWFASHVVTDTELWLAEDQAGTLVGILVLDGRWLDQLYIEPTMTGRGIGADLVKLAK